MIRTVAEFILALALTVVVVVTIPVICLWYAGWCAVVWFRMQFRETGHADQLHRED